MLSELDIDLNLGDPVYNFDVLRGYRSSYLAASDWSQIPDNGLSDDSRAAWATYRQELRDLTDGDLIAPESDDWPKPPS
jgi:hypothetical protein